MYVARPRSWLSVIKVAVVAFTGEAHLVEDRWVPATETSFLGVGYRMSAEINPQHTLFGSLPDVPVRLEGETARAPDARLALDTLYFPPDTLRKVPYWDYARAGVSQQVVVVMAEPALVCLLTGLEDTLPGAVKVIYSWTRLPEAEQKSAVMADLVKPGHSPVACVAGFELLMGTTSDLPGLYDNFLSIPGCTGAAIGGIVDKLRSAATVLSDQEIKVLAWRLLNGWVHESDPAALSSYIVWYDQHRHRAWGGDEKMREAILVQLERASSLSFSGPYARLWKQQIKNYASALLRGAEIR
jgi:hypothetical protein